MDDDDAPDRQPEAERAEGKYEMDGVPRPAPAKDTREMAAAAQHDTMLVTTRRDGGWLVDVSRIIAFVRYPDGVFVHGGTVRRSTAAAKRGLTRQRSPGSLLKIEG